ncbi:MAG: hypothetical protein ACLPY1_00915 [Terracidiphilus sp.]
MQARPFGAAALFEGQHAFLEILRGAQLQVAASFNALVSSSISSGQSAFRVSGRFMVMV